MGNSRDRNFCKNNETLLFWPYLWIWACTTRSSRIVLLGNTLPMLLQKERLVIRYIHKLTIVYNLMKIFKVKIPLSPQE